MEDLLKRQLYDHCNLTLPEGLKDLMSDICREVLRAQPENLLDFITNYLAALLVTRENLTVAAQICDDICNNQCSWELEDELRNKGFEGDKVKIIKGIVDEYFEKCCTGTLVKEGYVISKIMRKTSLEVDAMEDVVEAVRRAFRRNQAYRTVCYEMTPESSHDDIARAANHTLDLYRKSKPSEEEYERAATRVEAAYRAYVVRRAKTSETTQDSEVKEFPSLDHELSIVKSEEDEDSKHIRFDGENENDQEQTEKASVAATENMSEKTDESVFIYPSKLKMTASSTSLAGSLMNLPQRKPYSVHDEIKEVEEEKFDTLFDYTTDIEKVPEVSQETFGERLSFSSMRDYEPDDVTSSAEDEVTELFERKVVIDSEVLIHDKSAGVIQDYEIAEEVKEVVMDLADDENTIY